VIEELRDEFGEDFRGIIICASGLKDQWQQYIGQFTGGELIKGGTKDARWVGGVPSIVVDGSPAARAKAYDRIAKERPPYVILGYEQVVADYSMVESLQRDFMVGDEITAIKSPSAERSQALKSLDAPFIYGLTGDPIENGKPEELFSIMEWIDDAVLGRPDLFDRAFIVRAKGRGYVTGYRNLPKLFGMLDPAMVRITEDDKRLAAYMPKMRAPHNHLIEFDRPGAKLYSVIAEDLIADLEAASRLGGNFNVHGHYAGFNDEANAIQGKIAAKLSCMRMLCDDPDMLIRSGEKYIDAGEQPMVWKTVRGKRIRQRKTRPGSAYAAKLVHEGLCDDLASTPKMDAVRKRIKQLLAEPDNHKIIVFCFFKDIIRDLQRSYKTSSVLFHGEMSAKQKGEARRAFQHDPTIRLFLSSDAGGYGLDLPQAQYLLNIDEPYSAGKTKQRNTRHRRASSTFDRVYVENFLMEGSIEEFYDAKVIVKQRVAGAVLDNRGADKEGRIEVSATSLRAFLSESEV
jgi:SNF2 family DNA or RNA helicase